LLAFVSPLHLLDERLAASLTEVSLVDLAGLCRVSARHLTSAYRASGGPSVGQHIAELRIAEAKLRLMDGESVKAIAPEVGFGSPSSFGYAFRKATGVSPASYRNCMA
jgi:AraC family transcriptional regulator